MQPTKHSSKTGAPEERPRHPGSVAPAAGARPVLHRALEAAGMVAWEWSLAEGRITPAGALTLWGIEGGSGDDDLLVAIHPDDRAAVRRARDSAVAGEEGGGYRCEYRVVGPDGQARWIESRGRVERGPDGRARSIVGVSLDVTDRRRAEAALGEAEAARSAAVERERRRLQAVVEGIAEAVVAVFPKEGVWLRNPAWLPLHGFASFDELPGRDVAAFAHLFETRLPDGSPVPHHDLPVTRVLRGETFSDVEVRLGRTDKEHERWVSYNGAAVRDPDGSVALAILTMRDITARKEAEERQKLLLAELSHRVKNTLAVVQGIARQSLSGGRTAEEAREALATRLHALGRAHDLLTASGWRGASLRELAAAELAPYRGRISIEGSELVLAPKAAQTLSLVLHELATNAAKYGALSAPAGMVEVGWSVARPAGAEGPMLCLSWREQGGPAVTEPPRRGFGRVLIEHAPVHDLGGRARLVFRPEGVQYGLEVPLPAVKG
jgi:PAS domain S-box-containing protein